MRYVETICLTIDNRIRQNSGHMIRSIHRYRQDAKITGNSWGYIPHIQRKANVSNSITKLSPAWGFLI